MRSWLSAGSHLVHFGYIERRRWRFAAVWPVRRHVVPLRIYKGRRWKLAAVWPVGRHVVHRGYIRVMKEPGIDGSEGMRYPCKYGGGGGG